MDKLQSMDCWDVVDILQHTNIVQTKLVLKWKHDESGEITRYKDTFSSIR